MGDVFRVKHLGIDPKAKKEKVSIVSFSYKICIIELTFFFETSAKSHRPEETEESRDMANLPSARGFSRENRPPDPAALNHANPHCTLPGKYSWIPVIFFRFSCIIQSSKVFTSTETSGMPPTSAGIMARQNAIDGLQNEPQVN